MAQLFAGTSGFAYPAWKPDFCPADVPEKKFLEYYGSVLNNVEIQDAGVALCLAESERFETPPVITAGFVYARLRKPAYFA